MSDTGASEGQATEATVSVMVELFGTARMVSGRRCIEVSLPQHTGTSALASALAAACPELVGKVVREDLSGLLSSYTCNLNGASFLSDGPLELEPGDVILLFSSQAGG